MVFDCILKFPVRYKLTLISSFIIWVHSYHEKTHYEAGTYLYLPKFSWLIVLGHDWKHVSRIKNKINEQSSFKLTSVSDEKYLCSYQWKVHLNLNCPNGTSFEFTLFHWLKRCTWWRNSLGERLVTSIAQPTNIAGNLLGYLSHTLVTLWINQAVS